MSGATAIKPNEAGDGSGGLRGIRSRLSRLNGRHQSLGSIVGLAIVGAVLPVVILLPPFSGFGTQKDWVGGFADAGVFVLLAIGLNVVVGLAGLLDLGYAAFFAIGAYTFAFGASGNTGVHIPFWFMLPVGAIVAALFGLLLGAPTLRLRGDYLAIVTLGFGEIVPIVFKNGGQVTGGPNGLTGLDQPNAYGLFGIHGFGFTNPWPYYLTVLAIIALAFVTLRRLQDSRLGRAWVAIREDELAAASMGINTVTTKLLAFAIGASTSGLAGVFNASKLSLVSADQFVFQVSFTALAMVVLGGMGSIWSVAAGAFIVYELQTQGLAQLDTFVRGLHLAPFALGPLAVDLNTFEFANIKYLLYGLALVLMMLFRPEGLFPSRQRRRELHVADEAPEEVVAELASDAMGEVPGADEVFGEETADAHGLGEGR
jgi:ABC-type branched-subunit amino acid transport system permease subunit